MEGSIDALLGMTEHEKLDFKWEINLQDPGPRSALVKLVAAMGNSFDQTDAHIVVGVSNDRTRFQDVNVESMEERFQQSLTFLDPQPKNVQLSNQRTAIDGREYLLGLITIPFQVDRPIRVYRELGELQVNAVHIRQGSTIRLASPEEIQRMRIEQQVFVYGQAQLQAIQEEMRRNPGRGELLALEEKLRAEMQRTGRQLQEIGADLQKLGDAIQTPRGILSIIFANSNHGRASNIIGMGELSFDYRAMQNHRNIEKIKDLVVEWQGLLVELYHVQTRLGRGRDELDLYRLDRGNARPSQPPRWVF